MKLGEMLVRDGRLTPEQLGQSIAQQKTSGGRLGTVMVELGFLDLDTLTIFLGVELSTPVATRAALEKAKKRAVQILKPEIAAHYRCIPLLIQERQVIAAIEDPHDMESLDELLRITGYRVVPRVAPEVRIHLYLERYYGIERPPRFTSIVDSPIAARDSAARLPGRPLPGLPKYSESPIKAPNQAPPLRTTAEMPVIPAADDAGTSASSSLDRDDDSFDEIELEAADLLFELDNDEENADQAPVSDRCCSGSLRRGVPSGLRRRHSGGDGRSDGAQ